MSGIASWYHLTVRAEAIMKKKNFFSVLFLIFSRVSRFSRKQKLKDLLDMHLLLSPSGDLFFSSLLGVHSFGRCIYIYTV